MKTHLLVAALFAAPCAALAGWSCTMPNGAVVFRQLSPCPADAIHAEPSDSAKPNPVTRFKHPPAEALTIGPALPAPAPPFARPIATPAPPAAPAKERDLINEANAICVLLKIKGASTCHIDVNLFSPSLIDATLAATARQAQWVCLGIANKTRQPGSPFVGRGWQLNLFSPYGSGTRPLASCRL